MHMHLSNVIESCTDADGDGVISPKELERTVSLIRGTTRGKHGSEWTRFVMWCAGDQVERIILAFRGTFSGVNAITGILGMRMAVLMHVFTDVDAKPVPYEV